MHPRGHVGVADAPHVVGRVGKDLVGDSGLDVAASDGSEIDGAAAVRHRVDELAADELRRWLARDQGSGDDDVGRRRFAEKHPICRLEPLFGHFLGVPARAEPSSAKSTSRNLAPMASTCSFAAARASRL